MNKRFNATLFFASKQDALDAGYCDAVKNDDEAFPYMAVITFFCNDFLVEEDDDLFVEA